MPRSKLGSVLAGIYLVLVVIAVVWAGVLAQASAQSGEAGLATFFLTFPWSLFAAAVLGAVNAGLL